MAIEQKSQQDQPLSKMNPNPNIEDIVHEESEDEDTLSLCDLPILTRDSTVDDHYQDSSISSSSDGQEFFEFFSEEWKDINTSPINIFSSNPVVPQNTIFGGKKIPSHKPISKSKSQEKPTLKKSDSVFVKSKSTSSSRSKRSSSGKKGSDKNEVLVPKVSSFSSPVKAKLLLVLFGLPPKIPTDQMELKNDIRNRQSRHAPSTFFPSNNGGCGFEEVAGVHRRSEKGLWRLSKAASCFGVPADMKTMKIFD